MFDRTEKQLRSLEDLKTANLAFLGVLQKPRCNDRLGATKTNRGGLLVHFEGWQIEFLLTEVSRVEVQL